MNKLNPRAAKISQIGPLFKIEGGVIFLHPFETRALAGYNEDKTLKDEEPIIQHLTKISQEWFEEFPECCEIHQELKHIDTFNKEEFAFIPQQIVKNLKYFAYALEKFIDTENGFQEILDYTDYLLESFGKPEIGGHIFEQALKSLIEGVKLDEKELTDDMRLNLLAYIEPEKPPSDIDERDIEILYTTFDKWLCIMPNIGRFKELKEQFTGKIPMDIFMIEPKFNKYLGISSFKTRSKKELLELLVNMTNDILNLSRSEINKKNYDKDKLIIAAEERLRIQQEKLLQKEQTDLEANYFRLVENWLSIVIEFYKVLNQAIQESQNAKLLENVSDILSQINELQIEIATLCNSNKVLSWLKKYLSKESFKELLNEIENLDENDNENKKILDSIISKLQLKINDDIRTEVIEKRAKSTEISIKHKLKLTIPLFLFTNYEAEIELSDKQKLPKSLKELKMLLIE